MNKKTKQKKQSGALKKGLSAVILVFFAVFIYFIYTLFAPNIGLKTDEKSYLRIPDNSSFENVLDSLQQSVQVKSKSTFRLTAKLLQYGDKIRPGRYELKEGMSNFQLVRILRSGRQTPVRLTFNNIRTKEQLATRLSSQLMADSATIVNLLNDSAFLAEHNLNTYNSISIFIPNTYEVFWDMDAQELFERMKKEYDTFWNDDRKTKAAAIPLTPTEVSTLASIVEEETNKAHERPIVAGLYLNRLRINMPLQADPTVKFAVGDFGLRRIVGTHLRTESPYNTYKNKGLPPGPIRVTTPAGIDAVLDYAKHDYIFMCAKETLNGEHNFASNWAEHKVNAKKYQQALNERKIFN